MRRVMNARTSGFADLDRRLAQLARGPTQSEKRQALLKGGAIIANEERRLVPRRTDRLERSIVVTMEAAGYPNDGSTCYLGPSYPHGWTGSLVEFGTAHSAAEPFVRPAVEAKAYDAGNAIVTDLSASLRRMAQ